MTVAVSILLLVLGAILLFGVTTSIAGISINVIGVILMIAGALSLIYATTRQEQRRAGPAA